jgi:PKD repeat protein
MAAGIYTVTLTLSGPGGMDTITKPDYIMVDATIYLPAILKP